MLVCVEKQLAEFDLILHGELRIDQGAAEIWSWLERFAEWKESVVSVECVAGARGAIGEVLRIGQRPVGQTVYVLQKTLGLEFPRWKIQSLITEDGVSTNGYVSYTLVEQDRGTLVICNVMATVRVPIAAVTQAGGLEAFARAANDATREKLEADHQRLKSLAEREAR